MTTPEPPCDCACRNPTALADAVEATIRTLLEEGRLHGVIVRDERRGRPSNPTPRGA